MGGEDEGPCPREQWGTLLAGTRVQPRVKSAGLSTGRVPVPNRFRCCYHWGFSCLGPADH